MAMSWAALSQAGPHGWGGEASAASVVRSLVEGQGDAVRSKSIRASARARHRELAVGRRARRVPNGQLGRLVVDLDVSARERAQEQIFNHDLILACCPASSGSSDKRGF